MNMRIKIFAVATLALSAHRAFPATETIPELALTGDMTVTVESGDVKHVEYLSGAARVTLTKEGDGVLEIAIIGNTNAVFLVNGGGLKFVRPGKIALAADEAAFHVDGSDADARDVTTENGTNFVTKIKDVEGRSTYATRYSTTYPNPWLKSNALNGLTVFDFGTMYGGGVSGYGAAMKWSEIHLPNEVFYVWADTEGMKDAANPGAYGPTPVNLWYAGYRGTNCVGRGFKLYYQGTPSRMTANIYVDDMKMTHESIPSEGWHLLRNYASKYWEPTDSNTNSFGARGFGYKPSGPTPSGGFRLAEMIICTNYLTEAKREYVNFYLKRKWFGGYPVKKVVLADGATLDASAAPVSIAHLQTLGQVTLQGMDNLRFPAQSGASTNMIPWSGVYTMHDRAVSAVPNLGFSADGEISIASGTNAVNMVDGSGTFRKSGEGSLNLGCLGEGFTALDVAAGSLALSPLLTPAAALHVDAADDDAFTLSAENGTNFVMRWEDVSRNGQALTVTADKYAYGSKATINRPFRAANRQNGLPMVDFGSMADSEHQDGWGAMLNVINPVTTGGVPRMTSDDFGVLQLFTVWEDDPAMFDRAPVEDGDGILKPAVGPSIYGNGYSWYRGAGGNGVGFPFCAMQGPSSVREEMWLDNVRFYSQYVRFTPITTGVHLMDQRIGDSDGGSGISRMGGNQTCQTTNGPYAANGVYGGVRIGETMAFRYVLPMRQRQQIRAALGVKWFGTDTYSLKYGFEDVSVTNGATAAFPYADVVITNLTLAGTVSARSLTLPAGGTLRLPGDGSDGFGEISVDLLTLGTGGHVVVPDVLGTTLIGRSFKIASSENIAGRASAWRGCSEDRSMRVVLEEREDGLYARFEGNGMMMIVF